LPSQNVEHDIGGMDALTERFVAGGSPGRPWCFPFVLAYARPSSVELDAGVLDDAADDLRL
jgi:hypothetical protein